MLRGAEPKGETTAREVMMRTELPLFPLDVVLFPGMPLPLHIFEPRYRTMIARCLESDQTFGVALMVSDENGETAPAQIGCATEIIESRRLPDGRINVQTVGRRRFEILSLREEDDYLIGEVEWLEDDDLEDEAAVLSSQALRSLRRYLGAIGAGIDTSVQQEWNIPSEPLGVSMWIAALLAAPNSIKQELLETVSTRERLELELAILRRAEIVQQAFINRQSWPKPDFFDDATKNFEPFMSLN